VPSLKPNVAAPRLSGARRSAAALVLLALRRLRVRPGRSALAVAGVALCAAMLAATDAGSLVARDRAATRAAAAAGAASRAVLASWGGVPGDGEGWPALDRVVEPRLKTAAGSRAVPVALYRETRISGIDVDFGAVDGLTRWVRLTGGRLPRPCTPARCEVVRVSGPKVPSIPGVVEVGRVELSTNALFGQLRGGAEEPSVGRRALYLASGVSGFSRLAAWDGIYRTYAWVVPLGPDAVHLWQIDGFGRRIDALRAELAERSDLWSVAAPDQQLAASRDASRPAGTRLLLVGGDAAAVLLAFVVLTAAGLRRDAEAARRRLAWLGARRWQPWLVSVVEALALGVTGGIVGWGVGSLVAWAIARRAGVPGGAVLGHSTLAGGGLALGAVVAVAAGLVLCAALLAGAGGSGGRRVTALDAAALAAALAVGIALARGAADAQSLSRHGQTGIVLLLLPALVSLIAAALLARLLVAGVRLLERLARGRSLAFRLAAVSLARRPGGAVVAAVFVLVGSALAIFAATYAETLRANERDHAAQVVPSDYTLSEDLTRLVTVERAATPAQYGSLGRAFPVVRAPANAGGGALDLDVLGVPSADLPTLHGWRSDLAPSPRRLARLLAPATPVRTQGLRLPESAAGIVMPTQLRGDPIEVDAAILTTRGDVDTFAAGVVTRATRVLRVTLPAGDRGGLLVALTFGLPAGEEFSATHRATGDVGGAGNDVFRGTLALGPLSGSDGSASVPVGSLGGWLGTGGIEPHGGTGAVQLRYAVGRDQTARLRAPQPTDGRPVPVVVSRDIAALAGPGGLVPLAVDGEPLLGKVVATATLVPGIPGGDSFALADESVLQVALDARSPGLGTPAEVWLRAPAGAVHELSRPPFDRLLIASRRAIVAQLAGDPLAHATVLALGAAAIVALALAVGGLLLAVLSDVRDDAGELADLEALGLPPSLLRRHVGIRTALVAAAGLAGGIATGAVLGALVVRFVSLTAAALPPVPPLRLAVPAGQLALAAALAVALAAVLLWLAAGRAMREAAQDEGIG
jgi:hypothetical protein